MSTRFFGDLGALGRSDVSNCVASRGCGSLGEWRSSPIESIESWGFWSFRGKNLVFFIFGFGEYYRITVGLG